MLFTQKSEIDIHEMSPLALAFVGDAVLELLVRARLVGTTRLQPNRLHTVATHYVSAHAQNLELALLNLADLALRIEHVDVDAVNAVSPFMLPVPRMSHGPHHSSRPQNTNELYQSHP